MSGFPTSRLWDGFDDPYGPAAWRAFGEPQPSRPTPAMGAPDLPISDPTPKETPPMPGDYSVNGGYGHQTTPPPPPQPQK
jgi:hypothetical protein